MISKISYICELMVGPIASSLACVGIASRVIFIPSHVALAELQSDAGCRADRVVSIDCIIPAVMCWSIRNEKNAFVIKVRM